MSIDLKQLSRTMSYILRHHPEQFELTLDDGGWVSVDALLAVLRTHRSEWQQLCGDDLSAVILTADKQRYELHDGKIRAYYGHSVPQKIAFAPLTPPDVLFHGTTPAVIHKIRSQGLKPMERQYVHLSAEQATARQVALRRTSQPVILTISALRASQAHIQFYFGNDNVWLAEAIPPAFIVFPGSDSR